MLKLLPILQYIISRHGAAQAPWPFRLLRSINTIFTLIVSGTVIFSALFCLVLIAAYHVAVVNDYPIFLPLGIVGLMLCLALLTVTIILKNYIQNFKTKTRSATTQAISPVAHIGNTIQNAAYGFISGFLQGKRRSSSYN